MTRVLSLASGMVGLIVLTGAAAAFAFDYPTVDRVEYVGDCIQRHPDVDRQEMVYKCSCAIDHIRKQLSYDAYVESSTAAKAFSVAGERGNLIRDSEGAMKLVKRYRKVEADAQEACFIKK